MAIATAAISALMFVAVEEPMRKPGKRLAKGHGGPNKGAARDRPEPTPNHA